MKASLQTRLLATFLVIIAVLAGVAFLVSAHARATAAVYQQSLSDLVQVSELTRAVDEGVAVLGKMAADPAAEKSAGAFQPISDQIQRLRGRLPAKTADPRSARLVQDLDNMADSFLVEATAAIYAAQGGDLDLYFRHDREAAAIAGYMAAAADRLLSAELEAYRSIYPEVIQRDRRLQNTNLALLAAVTLVALLFAGSFARGVTEPVRALARAAKRIAGGDLGGPAVPVGGGAELEVLGESFNQMQESLRQHVAELQEKAELERRLQAEELEILRVHSLLREAELRALQAQVNPHFLFNTLNMVAKTALIEGAERTTGLLETVADLLRYSLRELAQPVTLGEEVAQVQRYMTIQAERFRARFRLQLAVDPAALATPLPCLTLQPLVENALIHGLGGREAGGTVTLTVTRAGDRVCIAVHDDGVGISPDRLRALAGDGEPAAARGHTTGLGLSNVRRRLELLFGAEAVRFRLSSEPGQGTSVAIEVPDRSEALPVLRGAGNKGVWGPGS